ncbi:Integrin alpha-L [Orchesella cincta]|uniref:Integrin alpha-L n=1 Tax=Orchesella cincta TaxID=48709 RepID=A0A1D2MN17_ORCCI|nr:Integrin alpha-L [Orchesella cincta]
MTILDFSTGVLGASVGSLATEFKVPIYDGANNEKKPLFLVLQPEMDPKDWAHCTTKLGFHQVKLASSQNYAPTDDSQQFQHASTRELLNPPLAAEETASNLKQNENNENGSIAIAIDRMLPIPPTKANLLKTSDDALKLSCTSEETSCMEIICTASNIKAKSHYHIQFILYPIKEAIDDIIKSSGKSRILVEGKGYAHIFSAKKHHQDDDAAQTILSIDDSKVELWIYIASGTGGLLLLLLIIVALYKCGFFKREKRQQLNHMKAEHHRKSMMVRASMMMIQSPSSTGTEDFGSQDMLAEAEHQNEDLEPEQTTTTETKDEK